MARRADQHGLGHREPGQAKRPARPPGQQRHRGRGQYPVGRPGDRRERGIEQQEPGCVARLGGGGQLGPVLADPVGEFGLGARRVGYAERGADPGHVGDVTVASGLVQGPGTEPGVGT